MYPINTILTFTSLTHASAAADLFGKKSIQTWAQVSGDNEHRWRNGFFTEDVFCMPIEKWRIILDTPEKVRWFEPQALDKIEAFVWSNDALICVSGIFIRGAPEQDHFDLVSGGKFFTSKRLHRITERDDKPFPKPQDFKYGGEA